MLMSRYLADSASFRKLIDGRISRLAVRVTMRGMSVKAFSWFTLPLVISASACSKERAAEGNQVAANRALAPPAADGKRATAEPQAGSEVLRTITLAAFSCGDSCYLEYTDGGEAKTALCRAPQCNDWADRQALPPTLKGERAVARFGTGRQLDAAGNIMTRDYPTIEELRIPGATVKAQSTPLPEPDVGAATAQRTVPARFRGLFAVDRKACAEDYRYNPAFQNVTITARNVSFFETGGPVTNVAVQGDMAAITLRETVGDGEFTRAIYLALNRDGTVRYRPSTSEPSQTYVRCGAQAADSSER